MSSKLPNGDIRPLARALGKRGWACGGATNEVIATSRDHAHLRVVTPEISRPLQLTAPLAYTTRAAGGKSREPKYRLRGHRAGASGHSRQARLQSRLRERLTSWEPPSAVSFSVSFLPVVSRPKPRDMFTCRGRYKNIEP